MDFETASISFVCNHRNGWRSTKHASDWLGSLQHHAFPVIANKPCFEITTNDIVNIVQPLYRAHRVTAGRLRQRVEMVLAFAAVLEGRAQANPARWQGHLQAVLPPRPRPVPLRSLPWAQLPAFIRKLDRDRLVDRAILWAILTVARRGEVLQATRDQVDCWGRIWHLPAAATKTYEARRIPLHPSTVPWLTRGTLFPLWHGAMLERLRELDCDGCLHGFRSTFATWARECTDADHDTIEAALGHACGTQVWRSYARSDLLERRRPLMEGWGDFCLNKEMNL